ncbi:MAG: acetoacetate--CoA ligase [Leucobacter sp.]
MNESSGDIDQLRVLWRPEDASRPAAFDVYARWLKDERGLEFADYEALLEWSVENISAFWTTIWDYFNLPGRDLQALASEQETQVYRPDWFPNAELNYAEQMLSMPGLSGDDIAIISRSDSRDDVSYTAAELRQEVARVRAGLIGLGITRGDRVAAYLPNIAETLILLHATASLGAIFTSCSPEFGTQSVIDRWSQIEPKVVVAIDGYMYGEKTITRESEVREIVDALDSVESLVLIPYLQDAGTAARREALRPDVLWTELGGNDGELEFVRVPFAHPLYILFSSGTTGLPKAIIHGHGGITLEHLKSLAFSHDVQTGDRAFWQTTTSWMMWNLVISSLGLGGAVVMSDINPVVPDVGALWRFAEEAKITHFGTSPGFLQLCRRADYVPREHVDLSRIVQLGVTGTACPPDLALWGCNAVSDDVRLNSGSGGTDICSGFVGDSPSQTVRTSRMASVYLGVDAVAFDPEGHKLIGGQGELVIRKPMPSMPVGFWGDTDGARYRAAYFEDFDGVWRHGDWITFWPDGSCAISGRSDATLNRDGVRLGTAEFYDVLEVLDGIADTLVVHAELTPGAGGKLLLFVVTDEGVELGDALLGKIRGAIKAQLSPRHLPDEIHQIVSVPRNLTGKKLEVPVKRILQGAKVSDVVTAGAMQNPESLDAIAALASRN